MERSGVVDTVDSMAHKHQEEKTVPIEIQTSFRGYAQLFETLWTSSDTEDTPPCIIDPNDRIQIRTNCLHWLRNTFDDSEHRLQIGWWILTTPVVFAEFCDVLRTERIACYLAKEDAKPEWYNVPPASPDDRQSLACRFLEHALLPAIRKGGTVDASMSADPSREYFRTFCSGNHQDDIRKILLDTLMLNFVERGVWTRSSTDGAQSVDHYVRNINKAAESVLTEAQAKRLSEPAAVVIRPQTIVVAAPAAAPSSLPGSSGIVSTSPYATTGDEMKQSAGSDTPNSPD